MVGLNVSEDIRMQQLVWNLQSQTPTIIRMLYGAKSMSRDEWNNVKAPVLIISGEEVVHVDDFSNFCRIKYVLPPKAKRFELGYPIQILLRHSLSHMQDTPL